MRNLLALIGAAVVAFAGVGWYMNWYTIKVAKSGDGNIQVQTNLDTKRVAEDAGEGARRVGELINSQAEKATSDAQTPAPATTPAPKAGGGWLFGDGWDRPAEPKGTGKR
ncbi:MAG: hypothetical protein K2X82_05645 [Gemmataceae bacterium]|nr:hypothetical protein [Gemmataceae bacterium]